jgi:hypothetical protein
VSRGRERARVALLDRGRDDGTLAELGAGPRQAPVDDRAGDASPTHIGMDDQRMEQGERGPFSAQHHLAAFDQTEPDEPR